MHYDVSNRFNFRCFSPIGIGTGFCKDFTMEHDDIKDGEDDDDDMFNNDQSLFHPPHDALM